MVLKLSCLTSPPITASRLPVQEKSTFTKGSQDRVLSKLKRTTKLSCMDFTFSEWCLYRCNCFIYQIKRLQLPMYRMTDILLLGSIDHLKTRCMMGMVVFRSPKPAPCHMEHGYFKALLPDIFVFPLLFYIFRYFLIPIVTGLLAYYSFVSLFQVTFPDCTACKILKWVFAFSQENLIISLIFTAKVCFKHLEGR